MAEGYRDVILFVLRAILTIAPTGEIHVERFIVERWQLLRHGLVSISL